MNLQLLYQQTVAHRIEHDCSAHPYEHADKLIEIILEYQPLKILEIGTGMGYTAMVMAQAAPDAHIDTIEKDPEHVGIAKQFLEANNDNNTKISERVRVINEPAETALASLLAEQYDLIFFDGFQIHYEFLPQYERLLKPQGILFLANNHLKSKTSDQFFKELEHSGKWNILEQFADTTIAKKV